MKTFVVSALCAIWILSCAGNPVGKGFKATTNCGNFKDDNNKEVRWQHLPIAIVVEPTAPETYKNAVKIAAEMWNLATKTTIFNVYTEIRTDVVADMPNVVEVKYYGTRWPGEAGEFANARVWYGNGIIVDAVVSINNRQMQFLAESNKAVVMFHELGHVLGMEHSNNREDVMYPSYLPDVDQTTDGALATFACMYLN